MMHQDHHERTITMGITEKRLIGPWAQVIGPAHPDDPALGGGDDA